jgi:hypothetical protein
MDVAIALHARDERLRGTAAQEMQCHFNRL